MKKAIFKNVLILFLIFQSYHFSYALNPDTHEDINEYIARNTLNGFSLENYLKGKLGFEKGITTSFDSLEVWQWLRAGGQYEDIPAWYLPYVRSLNHFHNPITEEGLKNNCSLNLCLSSTIWMFMPVGLQSPTTLTGNYSWYDVKDYYYKALTSTDKNMRNTYFAETFRGLGQVMHLIEDASVPAHARDDAHLFYNYEDFAQSYVNENGVPIPTSSNFFSGIINNTASFIDTNQYNGGNPSASAIIGLSEYTQANFFSEDTIFSLSFPFPKESSTDLPAYKAGNKLPEIVIAEDNIPDTTFYIKKDKDGEVIERFVKPGYFTNALLDLDAPTEVLFLSFVLDEKVYSDYASLLLPRAVGYSAGLLNYFFRGTLEITAPDTYVYSIIDGSINPQQFTIIKAKVRNTTPNEQIGNGVLQAVAKYKKRTDYQPDLSTDPPTLTSREPEYSYSVSEPRTLLPNEISSINTSPVEFTFNFENSPIPAGITDLYLLVVFKGTLGNEADIAIAAGIKDIIEPTHHVIWNLTDMVILYYQEANDPAPRYHLYTENEIRSRPELLSIIRQNNIWDAYLRPHDMTIRISYLGTPPPQGYINPIAEAVLPGGRHIRLIMLLDRENNNYMRVTSFDSVYDNDQGSFLPWGCLKTDELIGVGEDRYNGRYMGTYCDSKFSSVGYQEMDGVFRYQEASVFRYYDDNGQRAPFKQHHRSLGKMWISPVPLPDDRYYPDEESISADTAPSQTTINFP